MGPLATSDFYAKLIARTPAEHDRDHLAVVMWADPGVPDRVSSIVDETDEAYPALLHGARTLRDAGATHIAMPCHTAHHYVDRLQAAVGTPFVHMIDETVAALGNAGTDVRRVGLLSTRGTLAANLYQPRLARAGLEYLVPDHRLQEMIGNAIASVKANRLARARPLVEEALVGLFDQGADVVALACTELPIALSGSPRVTDDRVVDPTDVLAAAVVRRCAGGGAMPIT
jgi:aspartate racemase